MDNNDIFSSDLFSNAIDPFSMQFGMSLSSPDTWFETEVRRQLNKTFEQRIGEFHQILLGSIDGWNDLGIGDDSKVDLCNDDATIFIELKNKFNTCNSDALAKVQEKLLNILQIHRNATAHWAYIVPSASSSLNSGVKAFQF